MEKLNDLLWNNSLKIYQNDDKFKYSMDSLFLSSFVTLNYNDKNILDIGTGNAPIPLLLSLRTKAKIVGVEIQKESYELAKKSIAYNKVNNVELINMDINKYAKSIESDTFDVIVSNPPYFKNNNFMSSNEAKKIARNECLLNIESLFSMTRKILKNNGRIAIVFRTERLIDIIVAMKNNNIEPKKIRFIYPKNDKPSNLVLIEGVKNGKCELKLLPPLIVHKSNNEFTEEVINILTKFGDE